MCMQQTRRADKENVLRGIIVATTMKMLVQIKDYLVCTLVWFAFPAFLSLSVTLRVLPMDVPSLAIVYVRIARMLFQVTLALPTGVQVRTRA